MWPFVSRSGACCVCSCQVALLETCGWVVGAVVQHCPPDGACHCETRVPGIFVRPTAGVVVASLTGAFRPPCWGRPDRSCDLILLCWLGLIVVTCWQVFAPQHLLIGLAACELRFDNHFEFCRQRLVLLGSGTSIGPEALLPAASTHKGQRS